MELEVAGAKIFFSIPIPHLGTITITETEVNTWIVMAFVTLLCIFLTRGLKVKPTGKRQIIAEYIVTTVNNFVKNNMGERFAGFAPFIAALFSLSAFSNLLGLVGMYSPTADLSTLLGWALFVFVLITFYKLKTNGPIGYLKSYTEPIAVFTPFNIISEIATPISMAFRHFGNIASGGIITGLIYAALAVLSKFVLSWVPIVFNNTVGRFISEIPIFQIGIPAIFSVYFDLFSGILQAYIFCMLTMMYISAAAETDD